jgi:predicted negative regulator of RcsB-dependent stress response
METDEEQVEKVKAWLKENGMSIVFGIIIGVGGIGGYNYWVKYQENIAVEASGHFEQMLDALNSDDTDSLREHAEILIDDYASTEYALMARLALARGQVERGEFEQAESTLQEVVGSAADAPLAYVARTRLAAVQIQLENYDAALATLATDFPAAFAARAEELRGDAYAMQGRVAEALEAYRSAQGSDPGPANGQFLQQKIDDLGAPS